MHSYAQNIKTNKNWWVHLHTPSLSWTARSYARTIKTNKNWELHLLEPLSNWAARSYARSTRPTRIMSLAQEAPSRLFRALFSWGPELGTAQENNAEQGSPGWTISPECTRRGWPKLFGDKNYLVRVGRKRVLCWWNVNYDLIISWLQMRKWGWKGNALRFYPKWCQVDSTSFWYVYTLLKSVLLVWAMEF